MASAIGERNDLLDPRICCADNCMSGVIIMPEVRYPGDIIAGDMPILILLIFRPLRDITGEDMLDKNGLERLSPVKMPPEVPPGI